MGVVSFVGCLLAMDLLIHASAFQLGVKRSGIKLPWEREPLNPVFAKRARLIQPLSMCPYSQHQSRRWTSHVLKLKARSDGHVRPR